MPGCGDVCLDMCVDIVNEFHRARVVTARKAHLCVECETKILPGTKFELVNSKTEGKFWIAKTCLMCLEIREAFVCGSWIYGELYSNIEEVMFPIWDTAGPLDCLAKLESKEARDYLRELYRDWKSD